MNKSKEQLPDVGIRCPSCGCRHFFTTHTEPLRNDRVRRRKSCRNCGRKVVTFEMLPGGQVRSDC
jgi:hypothetical protein